MHSKLTLASLAFLAVWMPGTLLLAESPAELGSFPPDQPFASFWFPNELLTWDPATDPDAPYNRSAVPLRNRFRHPDAQVNSHARAGEAEVTAISIMNPSTSNNPSQGSLVFDRFTFNYWQYVDYLIFWGGSAGEGLILAPNPGVIDAAHRNGVPVLGTIFLPPNAFGGQLAWVQDLVQRSGNSFPVADKLIEVAEYYGFDGWFINQETQGADTALATDYRDFIRYIHANSNLHIQWYDSMIESGVIAWQNQLNSLNDAYIEEGGAVSDSMFLNFNWNASRLANSRTLAKALGHSPYEIFAGIDVQANGFNTPSRWAALFPEDAPHVVSLGFFGTNWTFTEAPNQAVFYQRANRFWVGANRDPADTSTSSSWLGVAHYIPAQAVVDALPFLTHFNTGQGHLYAFDGEVVANFDWNNRGLQDVLPTWRWRLDSTGTALFPELDWTDAYEGGTQLEISGTLDGTNDLALYQTALDLTASSKLQIAVNGISGGDPTHLSVGLAFENGGSIDPPTFLPVGNAAASGWNLVELDLSTFVGQTLAILSLRFDSASTVDDYEIFVGRLAVLDGDPSPPAPASSPRIENVDEIDPQTATVRVRWTHSPDPITSYQIFRRNGDDSLSHLGGTANNAFFVPRVEREGNEPSTTLEIQGVGPDGARSTLAPKRFFWADTGIVFADGFESGNTLLWDRSEGMPEE